MFELNIKMGSKTFQETLEFYKHKHYGNETSKVPFFGYPSFGRGSPSWKLVSFSLLAFIEKLHKPGRDDDDRKP